MPVIVRITLAALVAGALLSPGAAGALGLGGIELSSTLNQPLEARIPLRSVEAGDLDDLQIGLASREQFRRAGLDRPLVLSQLRFEIVDSGQGESFVRVTTKDAVREPFLNFLLEANWPRGRVIREYTVLLDPPVYGAAISSGVREAVTTASELPPLEEQASQPARAATETPEASAPESRMARSAPQTPPPAAGAVLEPDAAESAAQARAPEPETATAARDAAPESREPEAMAATPSGADLGADLEDGSGTPVEDFGGAPGDEGSADGPVAGTGTGLDEPAARAGEGDELAATRFQPSQGPRTYEVQRGDTLWSLAERRRPQDSVSIQQTMLAILAANPEAFAEANVNSLRAGAVLQMPELHDIAVSREEALAEVRRQNAIWDEYRRAATTRVTQAPEGLLAADEETTTGGGMSGGGAAGEGAMAGDSPEEGALAEDAVADTPASEDEETARLQVLASGTAVEQPEGAAQGAGERLQGLRNELNLTLEEMDAVRQQNEELRIRLDQTEALVEDLKRLVELKDDNIAALQRRLGDLGEDTELPATDFAPEAEPAFEEPVEPEPETAVAESGAQETAPADAPEPASSTAGLPPPETSSPTGEEPSAAGESAAGAAGAPSTGSDTGDTVAASGEAAPSAGAGGASSTGQPAAGAGEASADPASADPDSATETVAMVGEGASSDGGAGAAKSSVPKPGKAGKASPPPPAPSFLDSVLATLASFTGSAIAFGKSVGSVIASFIGSARESMPALPTSLPTSLPALPVDPLMLGAAGGGVLLLGAGWMVMRRRRADEGEVVEVELGLEDEVSDLPEVSAFEGGTGSGMDVSGNEPSPVGEASFGDEATGIVAAEGDDDPLAEVNVYLAYERFDQAEALVRDAIQQYPDRHEYKLKLIEVAHAAKNLGTFEEGARALQDAVGPDSTLMKKAVSWWQELSPGRELFAAAEPAVDADDGATSELNRIFDVSGPEVDSGAETQADERRSTNTDVDFDIGGNEAGASDAGAEEVTGGDLDFDLGSVDQDEATGDLDFSASGAEQPAAEADSEADDPTVRGESFSLDDTTEGGDDDPGAAADDNSLDFDLSGVDVPGGSGEAAEAAGDDWPGADDGGFGLQLDDNDTALAPDDAGEGQGMQASAAGDDDGLDFELEETYAQSGVDSFGFGLDEHGGDEGAAAETEGADASGGSDEGFDLNLDAEDVEAGDMDQFDTVKLDDVQFEGGGDASAVGDSGVSLDLSESDDFGGFDDLEGGEASAGEQEPAAEGEGFDLDLSGFDMEAEGGSGAQAADASAEAAADDEEGEKTQYMLRDPGQGSQGGSSVPFNEMSGDTDAIQTKLDLALAYIDMGDSDGARSILDEVMVEGNDAQKKAAEDLLTKLD